jgi:hypothetical protein
MKSIVESQLELDKKSISDISSAKTQDTKFQRITNIKKII